MLEEGEPRACKRRGYGHAGVVGVKFGEATSNGESRVEMVVVGGKERRLRSRSRT